MSADTPPPLPFDERNQQDFVLVTKRIQEALQQLANDRRLKKTETNLAKLAKCSRGTLRNRKWPLEQLQKLKEEARVAKEEVEVEPRSAREKTSVERCREQLLKNRDALLLWKTKHDVLRDLIETLEGQRDAYKRRAQELEAQLRSIAASDSQRKTHRKVVPFTATDGTQNKKPGK